MTQKVPWKLRKKRGTFRKGKQGKQGKQGKESKQSMENRKFTELEIANKARIACFNQ